jgi:hypothetical protein
MQPGIQPGARSSKDEVNYRPSEKCGLCTHFQTGHCDLVEGNIATDAICDKYEIKPATSPYRDKAFFQTAFEKAKQ